jgi:hypothetical protein
LLTKLQLEELYGLQSSSSRNKIAYRAAARGITLLTQLQLTEGGRQAGHGSLAHGVGTPVSKGFVHLHPKESWLKYTEEIRRLLFTKNQQTNKKKDQI